MYNHSIFLNLDGWNNLSADVLLHPVIRAVLLILCQVMSFLHPKPASGFPEVPTMIYQVFCHLPCPPIISSSLEWFRGSPLLLDLIAVACGLFLQQCKALPTSGPLHLLLLRAST